MGGNVFGGAKPIKKENIKPTLAHFFADLMEIFPEASSYFEEDISMVGSAGKKDVSGDIDLCLDEKALKNIEDWGISEEEVQRFYELFKKRAKTASKKQLEKRAILQAIGEKVKDSGLLKVDTKGTGNGTLFFQTTQYNSKGDELDGEVQIDVNVGNPDLLKFMYYSDGYPNSNIKGLHRTQLLIALFSNKGITLSHNYGAKVKETNELVADTPEKLINLLDQLYDFKIPDDGTINNFFKLQEFLEKHLDKHELDKVYDIYLGILDKTKCDIPQPLENYWLDNQERLELTGKFLPTSSRLYPFRTE